jgi:hypothetical protein
LIGRRERERGEREEREREKEPRTGFKCQNNNGDD